MNLPFSASSSCSVRNSVSHPAVEENPVPFENFKGEQIFLFSAPLLYVVREQGGGRRGDPVCCGEPCGLKMSKSSFGGGVKTGSRELRVNWESRGP